LKKVAFTKRTGFSAQYFLGVLVELFYFASGVKYTFILSGLFSE